jgi:hypothetical protein
VAIAFVANRATVANTTSATTTLVDLPTAGSITIGNYLILRIASDNTGGGGAATTLAISDPRSNTWTIGAAGNVDPGATSAGATCRICYTKVSAVYTNGDDLTLTHGAATVNEAVVVEEWSGIDFTTPAAVAQTTATGSTTAVAISRTPLVSGQLVYTAVAVEGNSTDIGANDSDTTDGTWTLLTTQQAGASGTPDLNMTVAGGYKIVTGTTAQTWNNTLGTARDWAAVALVCAVAPVATRLWTNTGGTEAVDPPIAAGFTKGVM